jgi:hypothetical protein
VEGTNQIQRFVIAKRWSNKAVTNRTVRTVFYIPLQHWPPITEKDGIRCARMPSFSVVFCGNSDFVFFHQVVGYDRYAGSGWSPRKS